MSQFSLKMTTITEAEGTFSLKKKNSSFPSALLVRTMQLFGYSIRAEQTVMHLYTECRRWRKPRRGLIRELGKHSISWQTRAE